MQYSMIPQFCTGVPANEFADVTCKGSLEDDWCKKKSGPSLDFDQGLPPGIEARSGERGSSRNTAIIGGPLLHPSCLRPASLGAAQCAKLVWARPSPSSSPQTQTHASDGMIHDGGGGAVVCRFVSRRASTPQPPNLSNFGFCCLNIYELASAPLID